MVSDVPIGAFLSSGIDSATVVNFMQKNSSTKIAFSIGQEGIKNEAKEVIKLPDI